MFPKFLFGLFIAVIFSACSVDNFVLYNYKTLDNNKNIISFDFNGKIKRIELSNPKYENQYSDCSLDTYTLSDESKEYGKLFIENIELEHNCQWNGLASGYFVYEFKTKNKYKSFKLVSRFLKSNFEISTYLVDDEKYVDIIDIFSVNRNTLIIDSKGKLASLITSSLDANFEYKYLDKPRLDFDYNHSLVNSNIFFNYFGRESMDENRL